MSRYELRVAPRAMAEIQTISRWWRAHRPLAPGLFDRELDTILDLLEVQPEIGKEVTLRSLGSVHVVVLRRSRYVVAYRVLATEHQVWIVRVRQGNRRPLR